MEMTPPHMQISFDVVVRAGAPPIRTVGEPGAQGAVVAGMQGMGVRTPRAAAVAAATVGFDGVVHMPKGLTFAIGAKSIIERTGVPEQVVRPALVAVSGVGAMPKLH